MSQKKHILSHLKSGQAITPIEALNLYGCFRLAAVIYNLRKSYAIDTELVQRADKGASYARYSLAA